MRLIRMRYGMAYGQRAGLPLDTIVVVAMHLQSLHLPPSPPCLPLPPPMTFEWTFSIFVFELRLRVSFYVFLAANQ